MISTMSPETKPWEEKYPTPPVTEEREGVISASEAKRWSDAKFGSGSVSIIRHNGVALYRVGQDRDGTTLVYGIGYSWDEAMRKAGATDEELEEIHAKAHAKRLKDGWMTTFDDIMRAIKL